MADVQPQQPNPCRFTGFPKGVNNVLPEYALEPDALRDSSNIDLYDDGKVRRRRGMTQRLSLSGAHSFWSDPKNLNPDVSYYVAGTTMYALRSNAGTLTSTAVATGLAAGNKVSYLYLNGDVFWTNNLISGRIRNGVNVDWGVEIPFKKPVLTAGTGGGLFAGRYQVALTYRNSLGEESGTEQAVAVAVATNGKITLSGLPAPISADVAQMCIYVSAPDGDVLHKVAIIPAGTASYVVTSVANAGTVLKTQFLQQMPAGSRIAHLNGFIFVASGSTVFFSEPLRYGLCNLNESFYMFPQEVTEILTVPDGMYVCSDKTYFLEKTSKTTDGGVGTTEIKQTVVFPFGAVKGTGIYLPESTDVAWFSPRGQVIASEQGKAKVITDIVYRPGTMGFGTSVIRERQGLRQIINTVQQTDISPLEYTGG